MTSAAAKGWSLVERNVAMTDYRFVMGLLVQGYAYRQIEAMAGCSHRAIARPGSCQISAPRPAGVRR